MIDVYSKAGCEPCKAVYRRLNGAGVPYTVHRTDEDDTARQHVEQLGYAGVPVVTDGHDTFHGYRPDALDAMIRRHKENAA